MPDTFILLSELVKKFGGELKGENLGISGISSLTQASDTQLAFLTDNRLRGALVDSKAVALLVNHTFDITEFPSKSFIICKDPYLYYARVSRYFNPRVVSNGSRHASAIVESEDIPDSVEIGANVFIAKGVKIGENSRILAGSVIEHEVTIGDNCLIHANVTICYGVKIGDNVEIHSSTVIGADGFGFAWNGTAWEKIPQLGSVQIESNVEIGSNVSIDRGAIDDTKIKQGVKIDNLVQIAHNCEIGENTAIAAFVGMAGSTIIGRNCRIAGAVKFSGHLSVADNTLIAGATNVTHSIDKPGGQYAGSYPFQEHREWRYNAVYLRHLKQMNQRLKRLEKNLKNSE